MNVPGFAAEKSLYKSGERPTRTVYQPALSPGAMITAQLLPPHCGPCRGTRLCCTGIDCFPVRCGCR